MQDNYRTKCYLKEMEAIFIKEQIVFGSIINSKIPLFTRKYYRKRNNKICYVDTNIKWFDIDWKRVKTFKSYQRVYINDWNDNSYCTSIDKLNKDYKEELINQYNNELRKTT